MRRYILILLLGAVLLGGFFIGQAQAVTYAGGTQQQRESAQAIIESCWLDYALVDDRLDEVDLIIEDHHEPYWETFPDWVAPFPFWETAPLDAAAAGLAWPGNIRVHSAYAPGPDSFYGEIVSHEWSHQIWYAMTYRWNQKWVAKVGTGDNSNWYLSPAENFAECMRVALWDKSYYRNDSPRTHLSPVPEDECREFLDLWRYQLGLPFTDLAQEDDELRAAAGYLYGENVIQGYLDGTVGAYQPLLKRHVALVAERIGLPCVIEMDDYAPALRSDVRDAIPGLTWLEERWSEPITRGQLLRLMYRARNVDPDEEIARRLESWFAETYVTWNGVTRQPRLRGFASAMVKCSREYNVPLWLALGQLWRESQFMTTGLSIQYNCGWGVKDTTGKWGEINGLVSGFADYVSVEECIRAYFRLMDSYIYRSFIDSEDWWGLLNTFAPAFENDCEEHYRIVMIVKGWCEQRGIR